MNEPMNMEVYIVRHGETAWNAVKRLQGNVDIELNANGRELAGNLGRRLEEVPFDRIYSSPLIRAYETACLIRGHRNIPIIRDERLREISFGEKEGCFYTEWLAPESPHRFFFDEPGKYVAPQKGETFEDVIRRTGDFLKEMVADRLGLEQRIMIVGHGALNKGLMCHIEGNTVQNYWGGGLQKNCEADIFEFDGAVWTKVNNS